jgi:hypothetical protein
MAAWLFNNPKEPSDPGNTADFTCPSNTFLSGVIISNFII